MEIAPETLRAVLAALVDAQAYIAHPASVTPSAIKRVATHRVPVAEFHALTRQLRSTAVTLGDVLRVTPS